ncbi:MAG: glutamine--tRNA ligase/YqeY domain fusion protein, partial [Clostridiales bacterium]|nr:glutamine--tRNA ligase/YqeY domain fusion protein [Clostridiales bacterium]
RFPPEPNGYLHIGHAKSILLNYGLAQKYNGKFNLRFDDTNPEKEDTEYVQSIIEDVKWVGGDFEDRLFYASDYFEHMYEGAIKLIKKGKAFVCDLTADEIREYRGTLTEVGKNSPYRDRSVEENLDLFEGMKVGKYPDGSKVLRAKIDMSSPNINMRDPIIYRVARAHHHNTGDKWCIYPMYDYAHPIEDAVEGITHSICTLEFEDHRPLYDWVVRELEYENPPQQIEFAKLYLTSVITGKRYIKRLVDQGIVDGWDDPRLVTISALKRRGFTPESIKNFMELVGVSKSNSSVDYAMLEYCIREDLKLKKPRIMAVLDPVKLVIDNYPEGQVEYLDAPNNQENEAMGTRKIPFSKVLYIEREDFKIEPPKKYFRLFPGNEVRLMNAYFVKCISYETDEDGNVTEVHCTYDPETKSGSGFTGRKVKGTIHWVEAESAVKGEVRLYENIVDEEKGVYNEDGSLNLNPNSITVLENCYIESSVKAEIAPASFQFLRQGFFCLDSKDSSPEHLVFNRIVSLKSSYRPG